MGYGLNRQSLFVRIFSESQLSIHISENVDSAVKQIASTRLCRTHYPMLRERIPYERKARRSRNE
ncbi:hypothetical protein XFF6990_230023 [Xanthomonas citri pv. fuscans]|nr:hypothetical protein XFF6990_230023 [Xanthomonas citri pv. fuscans]